MKLLVTGAWSGAKENFDALEKMGHEVFFLQNENEDLPLSYEEVQGVVCNGLFLHHDIGKFKNLSYIQLTSAGFDRVPLDYIKERNIKIFNARGVYSIPMAEFVLSGVLQLYKKSRFFMDNQKQKKWEKNRELLELYGKKVCIVGCGSVGTECAKRFKAFGCRVAGVDVKPYNNEAYDEMLALDKIGVVVSDSDVVVLTLPLTNETKNLFDEKMFKLMKNGSALVNISRGGVVDAGALEKALSEKLSGAVLDVFSEEPLSEESPLWNMENVIITPHNSFVGEGNAKRLFDVIFRNLKECFGK